MRVRIELTKGLTGWRYTLRSGTFMHLNYDGWRDKEQAEKAAHRFCKQQGWEVV